MSTFDALAGQLETQQQIAKGDDSFLSSDERAQVRRLLAYPEEFPKEFTSWLVDYLAVNVPQIPISQITGFAQTQLYIGTHEDGEVTTAATSYGDLGAGGPIIVGMGAGKYLFFHGCATKVSVAGIEARQSLQFNSEATLSDDCLFNSGTQYASTSRLVAKTLTEPNNTVHCQYKVEGAGTGSFQLRWLFALKYGNA